jgi:hypothetical protein
LRLRLLETKGSAEASEVTFGLDYEPEAGNPAPRMADVRLQADRPVTLLSVEGGAALEASRKELYQDPLTGNSWKDREDGTFQILVYSPGSVATLSAGRLATFTFAVDETGPVAFSIVPKSEIFAPQAADQALQSRSFDAPVVVGQ